MNKEYLIPAGHIFLNAGKLICQLPNRRIEVSAPAALMRQLLARFSEGRPVGDIVREMSGRWQPRQLNAFIAALKQRGVLVNAIRQPDALWQYIKQGLTTGNPPSPEAVVQLTQIAAKNTRHRDGRVERYHSPIKSSFLNLVRQRASARFFSANAVSVKNIVRLLWAGYGVVRKSAELGPTIFHHTVPSGGAIYPLSLHFVNLRDTGSLSRGVYAVHFNADREVGFAPLTSDPNEIYRGYVDPQGLADAQGVVVISAPLSLSARKYGNRGLLYTLLEAGHAAQNILLAATECKLAAVETGGFIEDQLSDFFCLTDEVPVTSIIFGQPARAGAHRKSRLSIEYSWIEAGAGYSPPFHAVEARYRYGKDQEASAWGRDSDPAMACSKAASEAMERISCMRPKELFAGRIDEVGHAVRPDELVRYTPAQYNRKAFPFAPFFARKRYWWGNGRNYGSGKKVAVLADFLYSASVLPTQVRHKLYTSASSSGVAAHTRPEQAIQNAALELVERDAFMRLWLMRAPMPTIVDGTLPAAIRRRILNLEQLGVRIVVKDISYHLAPVIFIFAQDRKRGFTRVATACSFSVEEALSHALSEIELSVQHAVSFIGEAHVAAEAVATPEDHALLYMKHQHHRRADFLIHGKMMSRYSSVGRGFPKSWGGFMNGMAKAGKNLLCFEITDSEKNHAFMAHAGTFEPLVVVRALIPGLIPISFGYGLEPLGMLSGEARSSLKSHKKPLFPHPFA